MFVENKNFGLHTILNGPMGNNSYIIVKGTDCVVIDPASKVIADEVGRLGLNVKAILLTHAHFDHIKGVDRLKTVDNQVYVHKADNPKCNGGEMMDLLTRFRIEPFDCDVFVEDGEVLDLIGLNIKVIHTPGHSAGSVCYVIDDMIFSGDTLFAGSYGRYDFEDGSIVKLRESIKNKLFALDGNYKVLPGHGADTTLDYERQYNPILWI